MGIDGMLVKHEGKDMGNVVAALYDTVKRLPEGLMTSLERMRLRALPIASRRTHELNESSAACNEQFAHDARPMNINRLAADAQILGQFLAGFTDHQEVQNLQFTS